MRRISEMETVQIECTNYCVLQCGNCTRFCGHHPKPYHMDFDFFKTAVDSLVGFPQMVGIMGGEPLLHPRFPELCEYALSKIPRDQLGLWTVLPQKFAHYREVICKTFGHIFINDHTRPDIYHAPLLVAAKEVIKDPAEMWQAIDRCWVQNTWSASINPKGAFFCEVAAAFAVLFDGPPGWPVEPGWWKRIPKDYAEQMERACPDCGAAVPLRRRSSQDDRDDVSPENLAKLEAMGSRKVKKKLYEVSDLLQVQDPETMAAYKDTEWRNKVAARYGMFLTINAKRYWEPHLKTDWNGMVPEEKPSLFSTMVADYNKR